MMWFKNQKTLSTCEVEVGGFYCSAPQRIGRTFYVVSRLVLLCGLQSVEPTSILKIIMQEIIFGMNYPIEFQIAKFATLSTR